MYAKYYLVSTEWIELPLVSPHHIKTARLIKYAFTGELDRQVISSPPFQGTEKYLLKLFQKDCTLPSKKIQIKLISLRNSKCQILQSCPIYKIGCISILTSLSKVELRIMLTPNFLKTKKKSSWLSLVNLIQKYKD
jgi:hypothetical protein